LAANAAEASVVSRVIVLVWLGVAGGREVHEPDLSAWAASRMVTLEDPAFEPSLAPADHEDELSLRIETLLAEARTAGYDTDPGAAETALESAELLLRGNPGLPEAPWLMAETCRDHAALVKARDPDLAAILERRAAVLDGKRARAFADADRTPSGSVPTDAGTGTELEGPLPSDEVDVDGVALPAPRAISLGEHHVRVLRRGRLAWSGWVTPEATPLRIPVPGVAPCSETDLGHVRARDARVDAGGAVLCPDWAVAREVSRDRIEISTCQRGACGTFLPWSRTWGKDLEGPMHPPWPRHPSNAWIPWTAASVTALAIGAVVLWQKGVFDRQGPPREGGFTFTAKSPP
jgi:hypothetical protein